MSKIEDDRTDLNKTYHLSTEGYRFKYEWSWDRSCLNAMLFTTEGKQVDVCYVYRKPNRDRTHYDVINYFEARISMGAI